MTDITCYATACKHNSSEYEGEGTVGTCKLQHINLVVKTPVCEQCEYEGESYVDCGSFEWSHMKPQNPKEDNF